MAGEQEIAAGALPPEIDPSKSLPTMLDVLIVNMDKVLLEGKAKSAFLPVTYGNLAILPGHTPLFTKLVKGTISINPESGPTSTFEVEGGVAKITQFAITILVGF